MSEQAAMWWVAYVIIVSPQDHSHKGVSGAAIANFRFVFFSSEPLKDL